MRSYPLLVVILLIGFAVMSFNPVYQGKKVRIHLLIKVYLILRISLSS
jgi:hypothetical protein